MSACIGLLVARVASREFSELAMTTTGGGSVCHARALREFLLGLRGWRMVDGID